MTGMESPAFFAIYNRKEATRMERVKARTLSGFMELLPAQQSQFERVREVLAGTYELYGFTPPGHPRH